jgi:diguanylate cyclase (GGDEF)-like protein
VAPFRARFALRALAIVFKSVAGPAGPAGTVLTCFVALLVLFSASPAAPANAAHGAAAVGWHPNVTVRSLTKSRSESVYDLRVDEGPRTVFAILPNDAGQGTLEVDGIVRRRVGGTALVGIAPLGHSVSMLPLAGLTPRNHVVIRIAGSVSGLRFVYDTELATQSYDNGIFSGIYYATIVTVALFEIAALLAWRDPTIAWYLAFTLAAIGCEAARDALLPVTQDVNDALLVLFAFVIDVALLGFTASYLRLRTRAPRLFVFLLIGITPDVAVVLFYAFAYKQLDPRVLIVSNLGGLVVLIATATIRRLAGYVPATLLALGCCGLTIVFAVRIVFELLGANVTLMNRWGLEVGLLADILVFSLGIIVRARFLVQERTQLESDLSAASYAAMHDELTGILNRRGLDARVAALGPATCTVLFMDVDGFKNVNDRGGHAAGDLTLKAVARILTESLRSVDITARVGGDEFVVVLVDYDDRVGTGTVMERIASAVGLMRPLGALDPLRIGLSIGSARLEPGGAFSKALAAADAQAYRSKADHYAAARALSPGVGA